MSMSAEERRARAQSAAASSWARTADRRARMQPAIDARKAALDRRLAERFGIPLDGSPESEQRLQAARRAHYLDLSRKSLKARREKREARERLIADRRASEHARIADPHLPFHEDDEGDDDPDEGHDAEA